MPHLEESQLDDVSTLGRRDSRDSLRALATAGAQVRRAVVAADEAGIARFAGGERPRSVLVAALGGSGIVGEILDVLAEPGSPVPVTLRQDAPLPGWIGPLDLVIAVSQSGRARGPLALAAEAARRGASLLTVGATDSPLAEVCARARGVHVDLPLGGPSSRTSLFALLTPVLVAADRLGLLTAPPAVLDIVADLLDEVAEECRPASESFVNPAKTLALDLAETVPAVLGDGPLTGVAASRAASMLTRTGRIPTMHGALPDAAASVLACLDGPFTPGNEGEAGFTSQGIFTDPFLDAAPAPTLGVLLLRDRSVGDPRIADAVAESVRAAGARVWEVESRGGTPLERLASLIALTDFAATYVALGLGLDPTISRHVSGIRDHGGM